MRNVYEFIGGSPRLPGSERLARVAQCAVGGCAVALLLAACGNDGDRPLPGYVEGEYVRIAAPFAGTLQQLSVRRGDTVAAGAPVFAGVSPGNARSLRMFLALGFTPICAEAVIRLATGR